MAGDSSPHNACGQILFSLKMTKLNYVVKGTPFSAYITIRKKFIQSSFVPQPDVAIEKVTATENELVSLKEKNRDLETKLALITFELEETQVKNEVLEKENGKLEDDIEEVLNEKRNVIKDKDELSIENLKFKSDIAEEKKANDALSKKYENFKKVEKRKYSEKCEMIDLLESNLDNKCKELENVNLELEKAV